MLVVHTKIVNYNNDMYIQNKSGVYYMKMEF